MNQVSLIGRIGNVIELQKTKNGKSVTKINLAVRRNKDTTDWFNCIAYNQTAENIEKYFEKGNLIGVSGQLFTENYEKDGKNVYSTKILINEYTFCNGTSKKEESFNDEPHMILNSKKEFPVTFDTGKTIDITDDDLPF